jgi:hypothetical protein
MPAHLAINRVALEQGDPHSPLHDFYRFTWKIQGNMGVDLLVVKLLAQIFALEFAAELALIFTIFISTLGVLVLSKEVHGRVSPLALFAVPLLYSFTFQFAMANYCISMGLALCSFTLWLKWGRLGRLRLRGLIFFIISPLLWLCHIYGWAVLCVLCFTTEFWGNGQNGKPRVAALGHAIISCLVLAVPFALTLFWRSGRADFASGWFDVPEKISFILHSLSAVWPLGNVKSILVKIILLLAFAGAMFRQSRCTLHPKMRFALMALAALYFLLPTVLFGSYGADGRLFPYIIILALLSMAPGAQSTQRLKRNLALCGLSFALVQLGAMTLLFASTYAMQEQRMQVLNQLPMGARLVTFVGGGRYCDDHEYNRIMNHLPSMALVRRKSFANDQFQNDQLMRVIYPTDAQEVVQDNVRDYFHDESQLVHNPNCVRSSIDMALIHLWQRGADENKPWPQDMHALYYTLTHLPRNRFDYMWLINPPPFPDSLMQGMALIAESGDSRLYKINP